MDDLVLAVWVLVIWISLGVSTVIIFFARHGRRSLLWYAIGMVLGPMLIPIAAEMERRGKSLLRWGTGEPGLPDSTSTRRVLVAVDGSFESDRALRDVGHLFTGPQSRIILLTVLDPDRTGSDEQRTAEELLRRGASWFDDFPASVDCEVTAGDPVEIILTTAKSNNVDLIVMGRRGRGLSRRILGSVTTQVVTRAPGSVLLGPSVTVGAHRHEQRVDAQDAVAGRAG